MKESLLLVFANKQDIPGCMPPSRTKLVLAAQLRVATNGALLMHLTAMKPAEVTEKLQLSRLDRIWYVVPSCATTGEGIFEGLVRLTSLITPFVYFSGLHAYYDSLGIRAGYRITSRHPLSKEKPRRQSLFRDAYCLYVFYRSFSPAFYIRGVPLAGSLYSVLSCTFSFVFQGIELFFVHSVSVSAFVNSRMKTVRGMSRTPWYPLICSETFP